MKVGKTVGALVSVCLLLALAACDSISLFGSDIATDAPMPPQASKLQPGDKLRVTVFGEDKLTGEYEIDPAGNLSLPLAGTVQAGGLTKRELEGLVSKKLSSANYLKDPKVTVEIATFRPFYVLGEVEKPGEYPFRSGLNVMSAMAVAGGSTYRASRSSVMIQRAGETEFKEYEISPKIGVYPGDLIKVPERYF